MPYVNRHSVGVDQMLDYTQNQIAHLVNTQQLTVHMFR
jgi:hypothetical protein